MFDLSRFRVITFDCYGTLIDWETGLLRAMHAILAAHGAHLDDSEILGLYGEFEAEAEGSEYHRYREVLGEVVRRFGKRLGFEPTAEEQASLPDSIATWEPFPDTVQALRKLKSKLQVGIISNIDDELFSATARRLEVNFDCVVTAGQARAYKPSQKVFQMAQQRLNVKLPEWVHAGQSLYHDVIPAQALGLATIWVNRPSRRPGSGAAKPASAKPDLEVRSLEELARNL